MSLDQQMKHTDRLRAHRRRLRQRARQRRGVLLLVVLSMLVLFLLLGTTFVIIANSYRQSAKTIERTHETSLQPGDRLDRALQQILCDTNNPHSSIRYHSLLRDVYGTDGFVAHVYAGTPETSVSGNSTRAFNINGNDLNNIGDGFSGPQVFTTNINAADFASRYADASGPSTGPNYLGPTNGQFIDIYIQDDMGLDGSALLAVPANNIGLRSEYVVNLETNAEGLTTNHRLSRTGGYYNGCLLTVLEGPAKGQTTRIVQYDYFVRNPFNPDNNTNVNIARFRVMAFSRSDGSPLQLGVNPAGFNNQPPAEPNDLITVRDTGNPVGQINGNDPFYGVRIMVNGRPYNGAGVGYNPFAGIADPKLNAVEAGQSTFSGEWIGIEPALAPNSRYFQPSAMHFFTAAAGTPYENAGYNPPRDPFYDNPSAAYTPLNNGAASNYALYPGGGGSDESYDAADFQNMFLALQSLQPRPRARLASSQPRPAPLSLNDPEAANLINQQFDVRLDLDGVPIPSFHRPALVNYWFHRLYKAPWLVAAVGDPQERVRAIIAPIDTIGTSQPAVAAQIVAIKRKISLRPLREDHPNFDGSNPESIYQGRFTMADISRMVDQKETTNPGQEGDDEITFPYWEATGPWDVDNDNDGVPDSIWVDLGDPVQELGDGRLYKPLYAILIEDMDGRLNLNAHGSQDHLVDADLDPSYDLDGGANFNLPSGSRFSSGVLQSTNQLPAGSGWGPGDTSLRPILSPDLLAAPGLLGDPVYDDYARLFSGRVIDSATNPYPSVSSETDWGRYGSLRQSENDFGVNAIGTPASRVRLSTTVSPGVRFNYNQWANSRDALAQFKFFDYPKFNQRAARRSVNGQTIPDPNRIPYELANVATMHNAIVQIGGLRDSGFAESPDLHGRYSTGLSYSGPAVSEAASDSNPPTLVDDAPYEIELMENARRDSPQVYRRGFNDDSPFSPAEFERILRASDSDAGRLPNRLWDIVNAFDPDKLVVELTGANPLQLPNANGPTSGDLVNAQLEAAIRRRAVTTESYEVPTPNDNWNKRLIYGADGRPGAGGVDEEGPDTINPQSTPDTPDPDTLWDGTVVDGDDLDTVGEYNLFSGGLIDANGNGVIDGGQEVQNAVAAFGQNNDDYLIIMGATPPANARLMDYLRYRVTLELKRNGTIPADLMLDANRSRVANNEYGPAPTVTAALDDAERRVNLIIYGDNTAPVNGVRHATGSPSVPVLASYGGLLAPEVVAGLKMDLNRPFGDGRDNNGNGVVDEEAEAGEPWIDVNGDGQWRSGEPYLDLDGDGRFYADVNDDGQLDQNDWRDFTADGVNNPQPVVDSLYAEQLGIPVPFDYTQGTDANGRGARLATGQQVHDDGRMARQLYARHLYCLMLMVMDENYIAPFDPQDAQVMHYLDPTGGGSVKRGNTNIPQTPLRATAESSMAYRIALDLFRDPAAVTRFGRHIDPGSLANLADKPNPTADEQEQLRMLAEARRQALRKLTCRKVAQWAINCTDMRDADAIRTPFEYDENPWDGWNVVDTKHGTVYPLDGDITTDENLTMVRSLERIDRAPPTPAAPLPHWREASPEFYLNQALDGFLRGGSSRDQYALDEERQRGERAKFIPDAALAYDQTRGLVWGMERPELLLTEGMGGHDRRVSNEKIGGLVGELPGNNNNLPGQNPAEQEPEDDLDQVFRPKGWAFVEVYNPWTEDNPKPAELFRDPGNLARIADINKDGDFVDANIDVEVEGVLLDRLTDAMAPVLDRDGWYKLSNGQRSATVVNDAIRAPSPVWRMICVEQHPQLRNDDPFDNEIDGGPYRYPSMGPRDPSVTSRAPEAYRDLAEESIKTDAIVRGILAGTRAGDRTLHSVRQTLRQGRRLVPNPPRIPDPDFPGFNAELVPTVDKQGERLVIEKPLEYIEREWYFTRGLAFEGKSGLGFSVAFDPADVRLCLPDRPVPIPSRLGGGTIQWPSGNDERTQLWSEGISRVRLANSAGGALLIYPRRFPPVEQRGLDAADRLYRTLPLAPILPGQFGVIGSAGTVYGQRLAAGQDPQGRRDALAGRYITRIGRPVGELGEGDAVPRVGSIANNSRRIELVPNTNPYLHQVLIGRNLGDEYRLMGPQMLDGELQFAVNATDPSRMPSGTPTSVSDLDTTIAGNSITDLKAFNESPTMPAFYTDPRRLRSGGLQPFEINPSEPEDMRLYAIRPAVAIPIEGMNISEPIDGYIFRRAESTKDASTESEQGFSVKWDPNEYLGEGTYGSRDDGNAGYDTPFDIAPELTVNHTTPNYRSVHLQRLANPLLAWNPEPTKADGTLHPQHDPRRPVNPYLTIDSMSLDVTAMNGVSTDEELELGGAGGGDGEGPAIGNVASANHRTETLVKMLDGVGDPAELHKYTHYRPGADRVGGGPGQQSGGANDSKLIMMSLGTNYRGANPLALEYGPPPAGGGLPPLEATLQPGRLIWKRERPNQLVDILDSRIDGQSLKEAKGGYSTPNPGDSVIQIATNSRLQSTKLTIDYALQHSFGYDNSAVIRQFFLNTRYNDPTVISDDREFFRGGVQLRGSFVSTFDYDPFHSTPDSNFAYRVDLNGDGILGDIIGVPQVNDANFFPNDDPRTANVDESGENDYRDDITYPWLTWNDRPYASALELLQVPASSSSRLTQEFNVVNPFASDPPSRYDGFAAPIPGANPAATALQTNAARLGATLYPYGHLLNVFQAARAPAVAVPEGDEAIPVGAPNYHRLIDYVHTPSRFVATDVLMDPTRFNAGSGVTLGDPRRPFQAPFNTVAKYREPGKINLNTIVGETDPNEQADMWSPVFDGLMHRIDDGNYIDYTTGALLNAGHAGPAWRDVVLSRRGYSRDQAEGRGRAQLYSGGLLHPDFPSRFANPFRAAGAGDLVPLPQLNQFSVDASLMRAHPYSPGAGFSVWGNPGDDRLVDKSNDLIADGDLLFDNAAEAGSGTGDDADILLVRASGALPDSQKENQPNNRIPIEPLFAEATTESSLDGGRNPGIAYGPMTRLANLTTTRSGVFGVWITVGFFEVTPADPWTNADGTPNDPVRARFAGNRVLYDQVYPDGYQLGREINIDTGDTKRFRAFYLIDRTLPVAFKPGENINSDKAILLRRRIE